MSLESRARPGCSGGNLLDPRERVGGEFLDLLERGGEGFDEVLGGDVVVDAVEAESEG